MRSLFVYIKYNIENNPVWLIRPDTLCVRSEYVALYSDRGLLIEFESAIHDLTGINKLVFSDRPKALFKWDDDIKYYVGVDLGLPELCDVSWNNLY